MACFAGESASGVVAFELFQTVPLPSDTAVTRVPNDFMGKGAPFSGKRDFLGKPSQTPRLRDAKCWG
jgi:hypothetical protein